MPTIQELNQKHSVLTKLKSQRKSLVEDQVSESTPASVSLNGIHLTVNGWLFNQFQRSAISHLEAEIEEIEDYFREVGVQP
jgi:hypothetical protein